MKKTLSLAGIAALVFSAHVSADPDPTRFPMDRAIVEVTENLAEHPNRGLGNALLRLLRNVERQNTRGRDNAPGQQRIEGLQRVERVERVERPERPERVERVEVASRADFGRSHRPDRPHRNGRK